MLSYIERVVNRGLSRAEERPEMALGLPIAILVLLVVWIFAKPFVTGG